MIVTAAAYTIPGGSVRVETENDGVWFVTMQEGAPVGGHAATVLTAWLADGNTISEAPNGP